MSDGTAEGGTDAAASPTAAVSASVRAAAVEAVAPALPRVFGRYLLVQRLSRGGMGELFLAKHGLAGFEKPAVIKKVLPNLSADTQFISRFVDEAQVAIQLHHVNVAQVFEVGRVGDEYFLALEYIEGRDLRRTLAVLAQRNLRLPPDIALFIAREMCNGLAYAHRRTRPDGTPLNLVHCDISPPNVVVSFEGETKLVDFGIAKSVLRGTATDPKMGFGKFGYMAPEQLVRGGVVDYRTDIYAAGVVLFELLTGTRLYTAGESPDYRALARMVSKGEHKLPSDIDPTLAPLDDLVAMALQPNADDRYESAAEFRDMIQAELVALSPTISADQVGQFMRDLFTEEMRTQRALRERLAETHLADFEEELHTQAHETITFAQGDGDPVPRRRTGPAQLQARPDGVRRRTDQLALTSTGESTSLVEHPGLADVVATERRTAPGRARRRWLLAGAILLGAAGSVVATRALWPTGNAATPISVAPPPGTLTVTAIDPLVDAGVAAALPDAPVVPVGAGGAPTPHDHAVPPAGSDSPALVTPSTRPPRVTAENPDAGTVAPSGQVEVVRGKWKTASAEYKAFKDSYGLVLEHDWGEMASMMTYQLKPENLDMLSKKIDTFRARIRATVAETPQ